MPWCIKGKRIYFLLKFFIVIIALKGGLMQLKTTKYEYILKYSKQVKCMCCSFYILFWSISTRSSNAWSTISSPVCYQDYQHSSNTSGSETPWWTSWRSWWTRGQRWQISRRTRLLHYPKGSIALFIGLVITG